MVRFSFRRFVKDELSGANTISMEEATRILGVGASYSALSRLLTSNISLPLQLALKISQLLNQCKELQVDRPALEEEKQNGVISNTHFRSSFTLPSEGLQRLETC